MWLEKMLGIISNLLNLMILVLWTTTWSVLRMLHVHLKRMCPVLFYFFFIFIFWHSAFFMVQLSHLYMTTGKTIALTIWTFVSNVMSRLCNILSRFVVAFLARSKYLLISWLQHRPQWFWSPRKKSVIVSTFPPSICLEVMGLDAMILIFWMLSFKPAFSLFLSLSSKGSLVPLCFLPLG